MSHRDQPTPTEDALDLSAIALGAAFSLVLTGAGLVAFFAVSRPAPPRAVVPVMPVEAPAVATAPAVGVDRLFGRVVLRDGSERVGYLRWNGREANRADLLPAWAPGTTALAPVRFGHVAHVEATGGRGMMLTLRSGETVSVDAAPPGAGFDPLARDGVPAVEVSGADGSVAVVPWSALASVSFESVGRTFPPAAARLHGTVRTAAGVSFTGYLLWNGSEGLLSDAVGDEVPGARGVPFAEVTRIHRGRPGALVVETAEGGTEEIRSERLARPGLGELLVSDPALGGVAVPWQAFRGVRFHAPDATSATPESPADAPEDADAALRGRVTTRDGRTLSGPIRWDLDEDRTWQTLDGHFRGLRFSIELSRIASVRRFRQGAEVTLRDGRVFELGATNDVNWSNKGIQVGAGPDAVVVPWADFDAAWFDAPADTSQP